LRRRILLFCSLASNFFMHPLFSHLLTDMTKRSMMPVSKWQQGFFPCFCQIIHD
jgi:hypothetical protein